MKFYYLLALASLLTGAPGVAASPCPRQNLLPGFDRFVAATATFSPEARATAFVADYAARHPEFYLIGRVNRLDALADPARRYFRGGESRPGMRPLDPAMTSRIGRTIDQRFDATQRRFLTQFPDFRCDVRILFGVSLDRFDGTLVRDGAGSRLLFGVDMISRVHSPETLPALFDHELFHIYHAQVSARPPRGPLPLWWGMWLEGLAIHASGRMNPELTPDQLFWYPPGIVARGNARRPEIARAMLADIDATGERYDRFFTASENAAGLPPRAGYYMGWRMAQAIGGDMPLARLARIPASRIRRLAMEFLSAEGAGADTMASADLRDGGR
jgi:hypothetical protein